MPTAPDVVTVTEAGLRVSEIRIGPGTIAGLPAAVGAIRRTVGVLAQPTTRSLAEGLVAALSDAGHVADLFEVPDRERAKTLAVAGEAALFLNDLGMTRGDLVVGVGGGAATDLAGFVAAVYLRGVECILVPTTLLGAVDAAIGGKTAVNVGGKNLVGTFTHPSHVLVDTEVLAQLPEEILREGAAEAVKAGFIADPGLVDLYERDGLDADLATVVRRAIAVKAEVVSSDFTERGDRAMLNYGHTIGHAVEVVGGLPHGHAVAVGMVAAGAVSERLLGFRDRERHDAVIAGLGLPVRSPVTDATLLRPLVDLDKKRDAHGLRMVLLQEIGRTTVRHVDSATVTAALAAVGAV
jgi:3-dehydroquinate synthetase